jgi:hypothetical protein
MSENYALLRIYNAIKNYKHINTGRHRNRPYPQIIHEPSWNAIGGVITCTAFEDANGNVHTDWIPAIRLE